MTHVLVAEERLNAKARCREEYEQRVVHDGLDELGLLAGGEDGAALELGGGSEGLEGG